ncbi:MAG TPA: TlpA disulfide reductase family protein [Chloroflexota bacterium]|nr:TlpA disulfide reductase family protein [Chloroflexota bacterium]
MLEVTPASRGWGRPAVGAVFVATLSLISLLSAKLALDAGRLPITTSARSSTVPGVLTRGQFGSVPLRAAPPFTLSLFSGEVLDLSRLRGHPVLVNFWASWCGPCREETGLLQRLSREYEARGVIFVGIDVWDDERAARRFMQEVGLTYHSGQDPRGRIAVEYGVTGVPETYLIDQQGRLTHRWLGPWTEDALRAALESLMVTTPVTGGPS